MQSDVRTVRTVARASAGTYHEPVPLPARLSTRFTLRDPATTGVERYDGSGDRRPSPVDSDDAG